MKHQAQLVVVVASVAAFLWLARPLNVPRSERAPAPLRLAVPVAAHPKDVAPVTHVASGPRVSALMSSPGARVRPQPPAILAPTIVPAGQSPSGPVLDAVPAEPAAVPLTGSAEGIRKLLLWTAVDPGAATVWADQRPDSAQRREALQAVCFKIAEEDPRAALDMAETFGLDDTPEVIENLIAQWAATDPEAALAWAARREPGEARDALIGRIAFTLAGSRPDDAARLVEHSMTPGAAQADTAAALIQRWSIDDAGAAMRWAVNLPAGPLRVRARQELAALTPALLR